MSAYKFWLASFSHLCLELFVDAQLASPCSVCLQLQSRHLFAEFYHVEFSPRIHSARSTRQNFLDTSQQLLQHEKETGARKTERKKIRWKTRGKRTVEVRVPRNTNEPKLNEGSFLICAIDSVARCRKAKLLSRNEWSRSIERVALYL